MGSHTFGRASALALSAQKCTTCLGLGTVGTRGGNSVLCRCVRRAIFRACYARFRKCNERERNMTRVQLEAVGRAQRRQTWSLKNEEFCADFCLIARRVLSEEDHRLFKYYFLLGADRRICTTRLSLDRGNFYHAVYRVQEELGTAFATTSPYPLFPVDEYFSGHVRLEEKPAGGSVSVLTLELSPRVAKLVGPRVRRRLRPVLASVKEAS